MQKISEWMWHEVFLNNWKIIKIPKKPWNIEEVNKLVDYARKRFLNVMADTEVKEVQGNSYIIEQEFIMWENLNTENIQYVLDKFYELLELHLNSIKDKWIWLDFVWLEWSIKSILSGKINDNLKLDWTLLEIFIKIFILSMNLIVKKSKLTFVDYKIIRPIIKKIPEDSMYWKLLDLWENWSRPELANFMIDNNWYIKIVDISLTNMKSKNIKERFRSIFIEKWNKIILKEYFWITY